MCSALQNYNDQLANVKNMTSNHTCMFQLYPPQSAPSRTSNNKFKYNFSFEIFPGSVQTAATCPRLIILLPTQQCIAVLI